MRRERVFMRLPYPLKVAAASAEGLRLRRWRYGPDLERLVAQAAEAERWTEDRWETWKADRLAEVLRRAALGVPLYRDRPGGSPSPSASLAEWPVLTKGELRRAHPDALVAGDVRGRLYEEHTSGSTGTPIRLLFSRPVLRHYYARYEQRLRRWNGVDLRIRWAILGGRTVADINREEPPYWVWNQALRQLYLSVYHLTERTAPAYLGALRAHGVEYLLGYPSALADLARLALQAGDTPQVRVSLANAEPISEEQRAVIEKAFGAPVRATYGMSEMVLAASECQAGSMHLWPDVGVLEILDQHDRPVAPGQSGRVVATSLLNVDTPLIRYEVGDFMTAPVRASRCDCGIGFPCMDSIEGRLDDVIVCPDGRRVGRLDPAFKARLPIVEAQVEQVSSGAVVVRVVPAPGFDDSSAASIVNQLQSRLCGMVIDVRCVDSIPRTGAGKFRGVVGLNAQSAADTE